VSRWRAAEPEVAAFGEATAAGQVAGRVEGDVEAGIGDEGFAVGEAVEGASEGEAGVFGPG
jgi:hypothetical protein